MGWMDVWNSYVGGYAELESVNNSVVPPALIVRYEDLVFEPEAVVHRIAKAFGLRAPSVVPHIETNERTFDKSGVGRSTAMARIKGKAQQQKFPFEQRHAMCEQLSMPLLKQLDYAGECSDAGVH
eukprot:NODE_5515_length_575_cov_297.669231.p2 GENE.NODE_5515_length_575_cov_297.669231~~NODE_5515_length_575_cov_297.669231.p2  ORF type:complete len:125 (-),score=40.97 NODE_5515_length_575_cov_297.669231:183-557(-)